MSDSVETVPPLLGASAALRRVRSFIERAAAVDAPVLLEGETGTGKGHVARLIHAASRRAGARFVAVNCAGIPEALFESEIFGHVRGAFTGADRDRPGLMTAAEGGTLLLDEVAELPAAQQAKLLLAIEDRSVRPVGATEPRPVDFRLVTATCKVLTAERDAGRFRPDLFHRVALLRLTLPPLRTRPDDILPLARRFAGRCAMRYGTGERALGDAAREALLGHTWPGNVRELAHVVEASVILTDTTIIGGGLVQRVIEGRENPLA